MSNRPSSSSEAERWVRIKAVFLQSLDQPETARSAFLDEACADDAELRREVESLLEAGTDSRFCEIPAAQLLAERTDEPAPRLLPGTRLGPYEINSFIAAGGMGEVYRARHAMLARDVAIKILGAGFTDEAGARRLIREARNASSLSHANICTIYEVGESSDGPFIVMEYLVGILLSEVLAAEPADHARALTYGIQIASALEHAHERGVVHRDLKSSNIIITDDGRPVVLDFGVARRLPTSDGAETQESRLTAVHAMAGTLSHMAPEVLRGNTADMRSDIWALGVVLYELVSGELPFKGRTSYETGLAILEKNPRALSARVPLALRLVIERCLLKDPNARYQSAADVRAALAAIQRRRSWPLIGPLLISVRRRSLKLAATVIIVLPMMFLGGKQVGRMLNGSPRISTVAMVPLTNGTGNPNAEFYADGLTDGLIAQLGGFTEARIIPRASAQRLAGRAQARAQMARQLGADVIVEGTVRRADERVAIHLRLIEPNRGRVLWSETYERDARDVLALQVDAVRALALAMRVAVRADAAERFAVVRAVSPAAYEAYLHGRYEWNQRTPQSLQRALAHFARAVEIDPTYAPAHAAMADCYNQMGTVMVGSGSPREWRPRAAAAAIKALQLDPYSAEAHAALGYVRHYQWQWREAESSLKRAIELNPSSSLAHIWYANLQMSLGRYDDASQHVLAAQKLDPFSLIVNTNVGWVLMVAGRYNDAVVELQRVLALDSTYVQARQRLVGALRWAGRMQEAVAEAERVVALTDSSTHSLGTLAATYARAGRSGEARAVLGKLRARAELQYVPPWTFVHPLVLLGDIESAADWTDKAFREQSNAIVYLETEPEIAPMLRHPTVRTVLHAAGLE
jgi:serine/threonine protein kinase/tetratricopeptide (TPR) repeat protein